MDFEEDTFASAPIRYALDDHDSDEETEACLQAKNVSIEANINLPESNSKWTLVFGLEGPGNVFLQSLDNQIATVIGSVARKAQDKVVDKINVGQLKDQPVLLLPVISGIADEEAGKYVRSIFSKLQGNVDKVIVLDSFTATGYFSRTYDENSVPPYLRVLQTSTAAVLKDVNYYEAPNTIKGFSAAIINYSEIYSIPCYNLLTLQESVYGQLLVTSECLDAYTDGFAKLGYSFTYNEQMMAQVLKAQHKGRINDNHHRLYL